MSGQLLELIIFAGIAFFIINKLISTLGTTFEDDPSKKSSFFGEETTLKDVTSSTTTDEKNSRFKKPFSSQSQIDLKDLAVKENEKEVKSGIQKVMNKVPAFDIHKFLKGAKSAFEMLIEAAAQEDEEQIKQLVDKRYIEQFKDMAPSYGDYIKSSDLDTKISEIYMLGNNIFIKILFTGKNITKKTKNMHEEWTFTKSTIVPGPQWHITNIDKPH